MGKIMHGGIEYSGGGGGGGGSSTFAGLSDVSLSNLADGQVPKYNATTQKWENANESSGGGVNYSTAEQVIGTWIDGKPLYQKTFDLTSDVNIPSNTWTDVNISNSGMKALIYIICANNAGAALCGFSATLNTSGNNIRILQSRNAAVGVRYVTIQYTKNTD